MCTYHAIFFPHIYNHSSRKITHCSTTNPEGQTVTSTRVITSVVTPTTIGDNTTSSTSSSHTGAIVGGVIGGVAALAIIAAILLWWFRRRSRKEDFDGNFDPDRIESNGRHQPDLDLVGHEVTPYQYAPGQEMSQQHHNVPSFLSGGIAGAGAAGVGAAGAVGAGAAGAGAMQTQRNYPPGPGSNSGASAPSMYSQPMSDPAFAAYDARSSSHGHSNSLGASSPTNSSFPMPGPSGDFRHPSPGPSLAMGSGTSESSATSPGGVIPSSKEREANPGRFRVANDGPVIVHQDGGRLDSTPEEENPPNEIPPTYDSIRRD